LLSDRYIYTPRTVRTLFSLEACLFNSVFKLPGRVYQYKENGYKRDQSPGCNETLTIPSLPYLLASSSENTTFPYEHISRLLSVKQKKPYKFTLSVQCISPKLLPFPAIFKGVKINARSVPMSHGGGIYDASSVIWRRLGSREKDGKEEFSKVKVT
jgi:hypothetical protein